ncbi:MAG: hypothetical protein ACRBK7_31240 [Acidimicrobiales bacterium]
MSIRQSAWAVGIFGALTTFLLVVGANNVGGILALIQLCFGVGAPLAFVMSDKLRSWQVIMVVAAALSVALSALSVQFLIWFRIASPELLVASATVYGVVLAMLFSTVDPASKLGERSPQEERSV